MKRVQILLVFAALIFLTLPFFNSSRALAGKYNTVLSIGDASPKWEKLPGVDGQQHSFDDLKDAKAIVVVFTCNSCPYAVDVEDRLIKLVKDFKDKRVAVVAINVNKLESDNLAAMKVRAKKKEFNFKYLYDDSQKIAKAFGATRTPEFFVLNKDRKVFYMGSFDDSPDGSKITKNYVRDAIDATLSKKEIKTSETIAIGCLVRFEKERRRRPKKKQ